MDVKFFRISNSSCFTLFSLLLITKIISIRECNVSLMKYFGLSPNKYPLKTSIKICGKIEDNCCSQSDELRIYNLWMEFSSDKIKRYISLIFKKYQFILDSHEKLLNIDLSRIQVERSHVEKIPYEFKVCERSALLKDLTNPELSRIDLLNHNKILDIPGFDSRKFERGLIPLKTNLTEYQSPEILKEQTPDSPAKAIEHPQVEASSALVVSKPENVDSPVKRKLKLVKKKTKNRKQKTKSRKTRLNLTNELDQFVQPVDQNLLSQLLNSRSAVEKDSYVRRKFKFEEELPERKITCVTRTHFIDKKITTVNNYKKEYCTDLHSKLKAFRIDDFFDYMSDIKSEMMRIITTKRTFYCALCDMDTQEFINPAQKIISFHNGFCRDMIIEYRDYIKFQNMLFIEYVDMIIQYIRCFQTTPEERIFPYPNFLDSFKRDFEYITKCIENAENENYMEFCIHLCARYSFTTFSPFFDGDPEFLSRVQFLIVSFFRKIESGQEMAVDYKGIEEDLTRLKNLDFEDEYYKKDNKKDSGHHRDLHSSQNQSSNDRNLFKDIYQEDKNIKLEKMKKTNEMIERMKELSEEESPFNEIEEDTNTKSIYEKVEQEPLSKVFRSKFIDNNAAINPMVLEEFSNFSIDPLNIIAEHCKESTEKEEQGLNHNIIIEYFSFNSNDINSFKSDLFLPFSDYNVFKRDEVAKTASENDEEQTNQNNLIVL